MLIDASHKLIPMTSFVLKYHSHEGYTDLQILGLMRNYANFLRKRLDLGMFVPIDKEVNILKKPMNYVDWNFLEHYSRKRTDFARYEEYQKAEQNCMFEGFQIDYNGYSKIRIIASYDPSIELTFIKNELLPSGFSNIESLTVFDDIFLTHSVLRVIGIAK